MARSSKTKPPGGWSSNGTRRRESYCVCPQGHRFVAELFTAVDLDDRPEVLELLSDAGLQPARCTRCGAEIALAEAFVIEQPERRRSALFVPDALAHRDLELRADALRAIAAAPAAVAPAWALDPAVVVGVAALQRWLFGEAKPAEEPKPAEPAAEVAPPEEPPPAPLEAPRPEPARPKPRGALHAAFADLDDAERPSGTPSIAPAGPQLDGVDVNEPLLDEDWLADDAIAPSRPRGHEGGGGRKRSDPPNGRSAKRGASPSAGVDFAGLLADDDEPQASEGSKRSGGRARRGDDDG